MEKSLLSILLIPWYNIHKRALPWRVDYLPYHVWISEIMLQQTQMTRGVEYFERFITRFPTVADVASSSLEELYKYWEGLGYYSRVRNIYTTAKRIVAEHNGIIPSDYTILESFSGIGSYTAGAIASIAFEKDVPAVDANVLRIFARLYGISSSIAERTTKDAIYALVQKHLPKGQARVFNQALMELGALVCGKITRCELCPLSTLCHAYTHNTQKNFPVKPQKKATKNYQTVAIVILHNNNVFIRKRPNRGVWANFWEFPEYIVDINTITPVSIASLFMEEYNIPITITKACIHTRYSFTHHKVDIHAFYATLATHTEKLNSSYLLQQENLFCSIDTLKQYTFSSGQNKIVKECIKHLHI